MHWQLPAVPSHYQHALAVRWTAALFSDSDRKEARKRGGRFIPLFRLFAADLVPGGHDLQFAVGQVAGVLVHVAVVVSSQY